MAAAGVGVVEDEEEEGVAVVAVVAGELNHAIDTVPTFGISLPEKTNCGRVNTNHATSVREQTFSAFDLSWKVKICVSSLSG